MSSNTTSPASQFVTMATTTTVAVALSLPALPGKNVDTAMCDVADTQFQTDVAATKTQTPNRLWTPDDALSLLREWDALYQNSIIEDQKTFSSLYQEFRSATLLSSDPMEAVISKPYQRIIGMGRRALPFIFKELHKCRDNWFWALEAITGENPVKPQHYSSFTSAVQDWILWGRENGFSC